MELLEDHPDLEIVVAPVGGGGLISGTALAAFYFGKNCKTTGAEPFEADDAYRSMQSGKIESNLTVNTIADGLKTQLGDKTFPVIQKYVDRIIRVKENEIARAMIVIMERMKIVIEPSSAVSLAAILKEREYFKGKKTGVILSGGNTELNDLQKILELAIQN
jgi:threonine dehydratase